MSTLTTTVRQPMGLPRDVGSAPRAVPGAPGTGITASEIVRILQQRMFLILLVWVLGSAATVGGTILTRRYFPLWSASSLIRVESPTPGDPFNPWGMRVDRDTIERNLMDQAQIIHDPSLLREVLASPEVRVETDWFKEFGGDVDKALEALDDDLRSSPIRGTTLLQVSMGTRNPTDAPKIVNKIVEVYMKNVVEWSKSHFTDTADAFDKQVRLKERELDDLNEDIAQLESEGRIPAMLSGAPTVTERLRNLQAERVRRESDLELLRARYEAYRDLSAEELQSSAELMARVESNPKVVFLVRHTRDLTESREALLIRLGPKHIDIREIDRQMSFAEEELAGLRQKYLKEEREALMDSYRVAFLSALQAVAELKEAEAETSQMQMDLDRKLQRYNVLIQKRDKLERERERLADAHANYMMVSRSDEPVRIDILRRATPPLEPSRPRPIVWIPLGVAVSLLMGVGLALALSLLDTGLKTPRDVIRHAALPLLGTVPVLDDEEAAVEDIETAARVAPNSLVAESFRQIRANLLFSAPMDQLRTILVTSASPSEGKTCVTINLGVTMAQGGRRILLIDANFRRPSLHKAFSVTNHQGLSNLLVGQGRFHDLVAHTDLPNLDVLSGGPCPPNPAELLASSNLRELLATAVGEYDQVLIDGPPVLLVSDAAALGALVDGVLLVCRARTGRGIVQRAKSQLQLVNARLIGAVLNAVETTRGGYFRKYYRDFYDYQETEEGGGDSPGTGSLPPVPAGLGGDRDLDDESRAQAALGDQASPDLVDTSASDEDDTPAAAPEGRSDSDDELDLALADDDEATPSATDDLPGGDIDDGLDLDLDLDLGEDEDRDDTASGDQAKPDGS